MSNTLTIASALTGACALALLLGSGCTPLRPYERAALLTRVMEEATGPAEDGFEVHVHRTREGLAGAEIGAGASCGCN